MSKIDWKQNVRFANNYAETVTPEFEKWWLEFYGEPRQIKQTEDDENEYFLRAGFALNGWLAAKNQTPAKRTFYVAYCVQVSVPTRSGYTNHTFAGNATFEDIDVPLDLKCLQVMKRCVAILINQKHNASAMPSELVNFTEEDIIITMVQRLEP